MSFTLQIDIVSAEALMYSGRAEMVVLPAAHGEIGVLPRHAPLLAHLKAGAVRVIDRADEETFFISGGFAEIQPWVVTVLADTVLRGRELDEAAALRAKEHAEKELDGRKLAPEEYNRLKAELDLTTALLRTINDLRVRKKI
jgi:F-type H+-transporting ATPase subunit epsilon